MFETAKLRITKWFFRQLFRTYTEAEKNGVCRCGVPNREVFDAIECTTTLEGIKAIVTAENCRMNGAHKVCHLTGD
jgi:hypothetical protein